MLNELSSLLTLAGRTVRYKPFKLGAVSRIAKLAGRTIFDTGKA